MDKILEKLEHVTPALLQQAQGALRFSCMVTTVVCAVLIIFGALAVTRAVRVYKAKGLDDIMDLPPPLCLAAVIGGAAGVLAVVALVVTIVGAVELVLWPDVAALRYLLSK